MKKDTTTNNEELNGSTFNSGKCKGLEELKRLPKAIKDTFKDSFKIIKKELKALKEIVALHDKWLGNEMSDFEFFTLLSEIKDKYGLQ